MSNIFYLELSRKAFIIFTNVAIINMITLEINKKQITVEKNSTVLDAAKHLNIDIPTLCYLNGYDHFTSCMICVVHEIKTDQLLPSCSAMSTDGMQIETDNEKVREFRKDTLDLLLSEHVGDCEAPCQRACPANMNIPLMIRQIKEQRFEDAIRTVKKDIALPAVLGRICHAPCENACRRKIYDNPVSICLLKRFVADIDLSQKSPHMPELNDKSGKKVAIIGAGATGLSAAYYLLQYGHDCFIYDKNAQPGGMLRYGVPDEKLPKSVLDSEIELIFALGPAFKMNHVLGKDIEFDELREMYDAVVIAMGKVDAKMFENSGIEFSSRGVSVNRKTFETTLPGIFAGGNSISEGRMAIRSVAHGNSIAHSVDQFLNHLPVTGSFHRFNSILGKIQNDEKKEFIKEAEIYDQIIPDGGLKDGYSELEAIKESARCFHCDCRKPDSCKLRQYAEEYGANQQWFRLNQRNKFEKIIQHDSVIYEPGKCIKCNLCVQITKNAGEELGLTIVNRGFDIRIAVPLNESMAQGLKKAAKECIEACPTAALSWRE
jgi:ferredoxin